MGGEGGVAQNCERQLEPQGSPLDLRRCRSLLQLLGQRCLIRFGKILGACLEG